MFSQYADSSEDSDSDLSKVQIPERNIISARRNIERSRYNRRNRSRIGLCPSVCSSRSRSSSRNRNVSRSRSSSRNRNRPFPSHSVSRSVSILRNRILNYSPLSQLQNDLNSNYSVQANNSNSNISSQSHHSVQRQKQSYKKPNFDAIDLKISQS